MIAHKRLLAVLSVFLMVSPLISTASSADTSGTRYEPAFSYLTAKGVIQGYPDGSARPYAYLNRAEALKVILQADPTMAAKVRYFERHLPSLPLFKDLDQRQWYAPYIEAAFAEGIVTGYPDRTFRPSATMSTEEALALMLRVSSRRSVTLAAAPLNGQGSDVWYSRYVQEAYTKNLFSAEEDLYIGEPITRGQFFDLLYRNETLIDTGKKKVAGTQGRMPTVRQVAVAPVIPARPRPTTYVPQPARPSVPQAPVPSAPAANNSTYFAVSMPSIGISDLKIFSPKDPFTSKGLLEPLANGVGHLFSVPGAGGKTVIYGHSSSYSWDVSKYTKIFRGINKLNVGDKVYVNYHGTVYTYEVTKKRTIPAADTTFAQGQGEELILYTCWPPDSIKERYLVHAKRVTE
jgi:LPXTG-site transpeptidase (sortase) family protein